MKKKHLFVVALIAALSCASQFVNAQGLGLNTTNSPADASAMLDVSSTSKGVLVPRMLSTDISSISNPATGLLVYQTDGTAGFYFNKGTPGSPNWTAVSGGSTSTASFADFFALMPSDNAATVAPGTDVSFPQDGPISTDGNISRTGPSTFNLAAIGTYQVSFQVSVNEYAQLILTLNGADLAYTVVGRATGTSQITGVCLVQTTVVNSILTVRNPAGNSTALTITPLGGGTRAVSAHLVINKLQ